MEAIAFRRHMRWPPQIQMDVIKCSHGVMNGCAETELLLLAEHAIFTKFRLTGTLAIQEDSLAQYNHPLFAHVSQSHMPQLLDVRLRGRTSNVSQAHDGRTFQKIQGINLFAFINVRAPLETLRAPPSLWNLQPTSSRAPREIRFFVRSKMWFTPIKAWITYHACILSLRCQYNTSNLETMIIAQKNSSTSWLTSGKPLLVFCHVLRSPNIHNPILFSSLLSIHYKKYA